jgi:hypothetical protein
MPMIGNTGSGIGRGESNKAKIARRVIEVLEFFDEAHPRATVMDIVRRFNRPQSSTSELLSSLVDLGLLYKDPYSRSYTPNFHLNAAIDPNTLTWEGFGFEQTLSVVATMFSIGNAATLGNWMVSGRLDRHPGLKIGLIESGMGWVPFAVEALEHQFDEMLPTKKGLLNKRPWQYFRDHFYCTFWFEKVGPKLLLETIGVDNVMFETDFPHPTSLYPGVQAHLKDVLGGYDRTVQKKVLQDNATKLYRLPF